MKSLELARVFTVMIGAAALSAGCVAHAGVNAEAEPPVVFTEPPTLVAVDGGVWVVRDSDYATYYVDDYYWVYRGGTWYRSHAYDGGWVVAEVGVVPTVIVHRDPALYVHFRGEANAKTRRAPHEGEKAHETTEGPRHDEGHGDADHREGRDPHEDHRDLHDDHRDQHEDHADSDRDKNGPGKNVPPPAAGNERKSEGAQPGRPARAGSGAPPGPKKAEKKHDKQ